ncbi:MAG: glycosyltransferase [Gemmatimonadaceae bacterium]
MSLYERVARAVETADVLINAGALNLHPDFLAQLPVITVLSFNDDPEASAASRPVAAHHDLCMIGNIAEVATYKSWGVRHVEWWPIGFRADDFDPTMTDEGIVGRERDVDVALLCERITSYRRAKVDRFALAFPQGAYYGRGWPNGFLSEAKRIPLLQRTKIGINIHNSTGPINFRTYYLPANGVLQICDNKRYLAGIYDLGSEAVGYDTIDEAIDLCRYYLVHDAERRERALAGWKRALKEYNEVAVFNRLIAAVERLGMGAKRRIDVVPSLRVHEHETRRRRLAHASVAPILRPMQRLTRLLVGGARRASGWLDNARYRRQARQLLKRSSS